MRCKFDNDYKSYVKLQHTLRRREKLRNLQGTGNQYKQNWNKNEFQRKSWLN